MSSPILVFFSGCNLLEALNAEHFLAWRRIQRRVNR